MNPYLEAPPGWTGVHHWLITELARSLGGSLPPNYYVAVEERVYEVNDAESALIGIPDDVIARRSMQAQPTAPVESNVATLSQPTTVVLPMSFTVKEGYLEIRKIGIDQVITVIEVLSPTNKQGEGRTQYETKRQNILAANCHLVEIDLLRKGQSMDFSSTAPATHYRILVSRTPDRPKADLYSFNLQDLIPIFPIPLEADDPAPAIDLKALIDGFYDIGRFAMQIDYTREPPSPKLLEADRDWCDRIFQEPPPWDQSQGGLGPESGWCKISGNLITLSHQSKCRPIRRIGILLQGRQHRLT